VEAAGRCDALIRDVLSEEQPPDPAGIDELRNRFRDDGELKRLFRASLEHAGVDPARTYWDSPHLRVVPPVDPDAERQIGRIGFHRDTWGSNVLQQTNWWTTVRPLSRDRTIAVYPAYWAKPIENTSAGWDLDEIRALRRSGVPDEDLPIVPEPTEPVDTSSELRIIIEPGDLLCFSGAHLHASVPNVSERTRVSVELRTVNLDDFLRGRGAPNLDGHAPRVPLEWFRSIAGGSPLSAARH
jgi:hypothetical protein